MTTNPTRTKEHSQLTILPFYYIHEIALRLHMRKSIEEGITPMNIAAIKFFNGNCIVSAAKLITEE